LDLSQFNNELLTVDEASVYSVEADGSVHIFVRAEWATPITSSGSNTVYRRLWVEQKQGGEWVPRIVELASTHSYATDAEVASALLSPQKREVLLVFNLRHERLAESVNSEDVFTDHGTVHAASKLNKSGGTCVVKVWSWSDTGDVIAYQVLYCYGGGGGLPCNQYSLTCGGGGGAGGGHIPIDAIEINTDELVDCLSNVFDDLDVLNSQTMKDFATDGFPVDWYLTTGSAAGNANTGFQIANSRIATTFDVGKFAGATDLAVARSIIHESVHAYLIALNASDHDGFNSAFPFLWSDYRNIENKFGYNGAGNIAHHNEFIRIFISSMADDLKAYGMSRGYRLSDQFYEDMSWGGLAQRATVQYVVRAGQSQNSTNAGIRADWIKRERNQCWLLI
jgi:hypothetical protein